MASQHSGNAALRLTGEPFDKQPTIADDATSSASTGASWGLSSSYTVSSWALSRRSSTDHHPEFSHSLEGLGPEASASLGPLPEEGFGDDFADVYDEVAGEGAAPVPSRTRLESLAGQQAATSPSRRDREARRRRKTKKQDGEGREAASEELERRLLQEQTDSSAAAAAAAVGSSAQVFPSEGSRKHYIGECRPCAWFWKPEGCRNGADCYHCHLCASGELKARKRAKALQKSTEEAARSANLRQLQQQLQQQQQQQQQQMQQQQMQQQEVMRGCEEESAVVAQQQQAQSSAAVATPVSSQPLQTAATPILLPVHTLNMGAVAAAPRELTQGSVMLVIPKLSAPPPPPQQQPGFVPALGHRHGATAPPSTVASHTGQAMVTTPTAWISQVGVPLQLSSIVACAQPPPATSMSQPVQDLSSSACQRPEVTTLPVDSGSSACGSMQPPQPCSPAAPPYPQPMAASSVPQSGVSSGSSVLEGLFGDGLPSVGSALHASGACKPCAWFWKASGCRNGTACGHCHLCPAGESKARKKKKARKLRLSAVVTTPQIHIAEVSSPQRPLPQQQQQHQRDAQQWQAASASSMSGEAGGAPTLQPSLLSAGFVGSVPGAEPAGAGWPEATPTADAPWSGFPTPSDGNTPVAGGSRDLRGLRWHD